MDWTPLVNSVISGVAVIVGLAITAIAAVYVPRAIAAFEKATGVKVTDQERAAIYNSLDTAKGMLQTQLDQGRIKVSDITPSSTAVVEAAKAALARVPDSAAAQGTSVASAAAIIVAKVDTSPKPAVVVLPPGVVLAPVGA